MSVLLRGSVLPRRSVLRLLLVSVVLLCVRAPQGFGQVDVEPSDQFELTEVLSIGDDEDAPLEYLFSSPQRVRTDADGRIYVAELRTDSVRVFGPNGDYLGALGRSGEGPGEFQDLRTIALDAEDRLVTYDRMLGRFTRFPSFEEIESFPLPEQGVETHSNPEEFLLNPRFMYGLPNGHFVLYYHSLTDQSLDQPRLHVLSDSFQKVSSFGRPTAWDLPDDGFTTQLTKRFEVFSGSHVAPGSSRLLLSPWPYDGTLYQYVPGEDATWSIRTLEGRDPGHPTHEVVYHEVISPSEAQSGRHSSAPPCRQLNSSLERKLMRSCGRPRSTSMGVGQLSDGRIVHLSFSEDENGVPQLQLELFGADGTLEKVGRIERFQHEKSQYREAIQHIGVSVLWIDRRDRLYLVDRRSGAPVLRVMRREE